MPGGRRLMEPAIVSYEMNRTPKGSELEWPKKSKILSRRKKPSKTLQYGADITNYQQATPRLNVCEVGTETLHEKFKRLLNEWQEETIFMSSMTEMVMLRSYHAIIGMGPAAVRLILNEIKHNPDYLFWALEAITGVNPVLPEDEGNLNRMTKAWIEWGRENGII